MLIVTHNIQQAARVSDYTAFMYLGHLVEELSGIRVGHDERACAFARVDLRAAAGRLVEVGAGDEPFVGRRVGCGDVVGRAIALAMGKACASVATSSRTLEQAELVAEPYRNDSRALARPALPWRFCVSSTCPSNASPPR